MKLKPIIKKAQHYCLAFAILLFITVSCGEAQKAADNPNDIAALKEIREEPKIIEATITDANVLYVFVQDDGTKRDGYADYLCQVLDNHKAMTNWVKVVKVGSTKDPKADNAYGVLLGESHCEFRNQ